MLPSKRSGSYLCKRKLKREQELQKNRKCFVEFFVFVFHNLVSPQSVEKTWGANLVLYTIFVNAKISRLLLSNNMKQTFKAYNFKMVVRY